MPVQGRDVEIPAAPWGMAWDTGHFAAAPALDQHGAAVRAEFSGLKTDTPENTPA